MIAGKADITQCKTQMSAHMPRGVQNLDAQSGKRQPFPIDQCAVGGKARVSPFATPRQTLRSQTLHQRSAPIACPAKGQNRGPRGAAERRAQGAVIQMGVAQKNCSHGYPATNRQNRVKMGRQRRAGINHHTGPLPVQDIGVCPGAGHGRRVLCAQPCDAQSHACYRSGHARPFPWPVAPASLARMKLTLKPFLPSGLFGRAILILVLPVVVVQVAVSVAFIQRHFKGVTHQMTEGVLIEMRYVLAQVDQAADPLVAQAAAAEVARNLDLMMTLPVPEAAVPATDDRGWLDWSGREVIATLRAGLQGVLAVDLTSGEGDVRVYLATPDGPMRLIVERSRVSASNPHQLLVWMVFTSALMTLIAYVFLRNQLSPITRLAAAAEAFGKGQTVPYKPRGATEVRAAGRAFLDMRGRIERQIESRTLLLSGVSHDLRTPLTRLKLGLSFLPDDDDTRALQQDVLDMERLVAEFLAFVRGDVLEDAEMVDPVALLQRAVENAVRIGQAVTLGETVAPDAVRLRPQAIMRALDNLISNAVRYGKHAEVSLRRTEGMLRFVIEDDGPGIPPERRAEAMEPFKRLDAARDPNKGGGVGLGLAIAADIARSHGGRLRLGESARLGGLLAELSVAL